MILPIYLYGQPVLRKPTEEIEPMPELKQFISDMYETLTQAEGCGLAAPQVGKPWRLFVVDGDELAEDYPECKDFKRTFINPEMLEESEGVKFETVQSPVPFNVWVQVLPVDENNAKMKVTVKAELNPFIKSMVEKPLQDGVEKIADALAQIKYV